MNVEYLQFHSVSYCVKNTPRLPYKLLHIFRPVTVIITGIFSCYPLSKCMYVIAVGCNNVFFKLVDFVRALYLIE